MEKHATYDYVTILRNNSDQIGDDAFWISLTRDFLRLPLEYMSAVYEVIRQARWKSATDPRCYLRTAAKREAARQGLVKGRRDTQLVSFSGGRSVDGESISPGDYLDYLSPQGGLQRRQGKWHAVPRDYEEGTLVDHVSYKLPADLNREECISVPVEDAGNESESPNETAFNIVIVWDKIAKFAGLDALQRRVLQYHLERVSRDQAMAEQTCPADRKQIQAAWRRFDRAGKKKLYKAFKTLMSRN